MKYLKGILPAFVFFGLACSGQPVTDHPTEGDSIAWKFLGNESQQISKSFMDGIQSKEDWLSKRPEYLKEYFYMLGLDPMPEKTLLKPTITGTLERDGYVVDKLHYQSMPGLYVTANLYRPAYTKPGEKLPAILYVCGHAERGRNGNKTAYQSHGIWFARHGYVCLMVDTIQRGEIAGIHHGTYRHNRWWWHSRGYTPSGSETWNGIRGIDYLISRPDVDADRIGVTGISGGGAVSFWVAAADERVKVAIPVSGMADLPSYLGDHIINHHCDCMFFYNTYQWPWTRIAALIAPRPLLFVNSDSDPLFPMNANERVSNRMESFYSLFGAGDRFETLVSIGGHAYREDIRKAAFRFMNIYLKNDSTPVNDSEVDLVTGARDHEIHPIPPEDLRVFPTDADIPKDEINSTIDEKFLPIAKAGLPKRGGFQVWKRQLLENLKEATFRAFPESIQSASSGKISPYLETEKGILVTLKQKQDPASAKRIQLIVSSEDLDDIPPVLKTEASDAVYILEPRGTGNLTWTVRNPPNYVARSYALLGRTIAEGRIRDIIAIAKFLKEKNGRDVPLVISGSGPDAIVAAYAMLLEPQIDEAVLVNPPSSHMSDDCPPLMNVMRVCDVPDVLGCLAPRKLTVAGLDYNAAYRVQQIYRAASALSNLGLRDKL
ncbi:MAG: prolyl oligopeptidase family serine peptidase [Verrucomicrobiae bacterium]|nr:prolyl oligopeptidase family serine peptidase [Verrucomicrobiae bacterium]